MYIYTIHSSQEKVAMYNTEVYNIYGLLFSYLVTHETLVQDGSIFLNSPTWERETQKKGEKKRKRNEENFGLRAGFTTPGCGHQSERTGEVSIIHNLGYKVKKRSSFFDYCLPCFVLVSFYFHSVGKVFTQVAVVFIFSVHSQSFWFDYTHALKNGVTQLTQSTTVHHWIDTPSLYADGRRTTIQQLHDEITDGWIHLS